MKASDFEYDGLLLSDFGCIICTFDSIGQENITMGSNITFNTTYIPGAKKFMKNSISYDTCLETDFYICKNPCGIIDQTDMYFSLEELRQIMRWLNREEFLRFRLIDDDHDEFFYEGSFYNIERIESAGDIIGMHLYLTTNSPFAFHDEKIFNFNIASANGSYIIHDISDQIGYLYPELEIKCNSSGTLKITNSMNDKVCEISGCISGEIITMKDMIIETSNAGHQATIMNDFNFNFVTLSNDFDERTNKLTFSLPCDVTLKYTPIMKAGI